MTAKELIERLQQVPEDAVIEYYSEGGEDYWGGWTEVCEWEYEYDNKENVVRIG